MLKLNLGCGPHALEGWINYDIEEHKGVKKLDLSLGRLPHPDNSVDFIFSEHHVEHLIREQFLRLLKDCYRVLKPDGAIRISTPDLKFLAKEYLEKNITHWSPTWNPETPCQMLNYGLSLWGHKFVYDSDEMHLCLSEAGFKIMYRQHYRASTYKELSNLEVRPYINDLIVEAVK